MLLFGGSDGTRCRGDTWALSLGEHPAWTLVQGESDPRLARVFHSAIYDERERRLVIWGGYQCLARRDVNDCWALSLKGKPEWRELGSANAPPEAREGHTAIYDPAGERMVIFTGNGTLNDTWALPLSPSRHEGEEEDEATAPAQAASAAELELGAPRPNPFEGGAELAFTLPASSRVSLAVYDAGGRSVRRLVAGTLAPGAHHVWWDGRDAAGRRAASGLYFVRLETEAAVRVQKAVLARPTVLR